MLFCKHYLIIVNISFTFAVCKCTHLCIQENHLNQLLRIINPKKIKSMFFKKLKKGVIKRIEELKEDDPLGKLFIQKHEKANGNTLYRVCFKEEILCVRPTFTEALDAFIICEKNIKRWGGTTNQKIILTKNIYA